MYHLGVGVADITPEVGTALSGFIARENRPSTHVDSGLQVRVLAIKQGTETYFLFNYDLIGLGTEAAERILATLERWLEAGFSRERCLLTATHTHSGPPTGLLVGERLLDPEYSELLTGRSLRAARAALESLQPVRMLSAEIPLPGLTYNRRALLMDGRVSIMPTPDLPVVQRGPLDERMTVLAWRDQEGKNVAALAHYACHGVAVLSQGIGSDIPGALAEAIGMELEAPCLFLQGAAGDVNPTTVTAGRAEMLAWVEQAMQPLSSLNEILQPAQLDDFQAVEGWLGLSYSGLAGLEEAEMEARNLQRVADGDVTSPDLQEALRSFKNTLNMPPDEALDAKKTRFVALALAETAQKTLDAVRAGGDLPRQKLHMAAWRLGDFVLLFLACEALTATGLRLRALCPEMRILPVTYLAPLLGYIPDREAVRLGGYEVRDGWRFYGHPAPFAADSEERILQHADKLLAELI